MNKNKGKIQTGVTRREFMKKGAVAMGAAMASSVAIPKLVKPAGAAKRDFILIGRPNPTTGPLAAFGDGTPWVDEKALAVINKDGGIYIKEFGKKVPVKIKVVDTESSPTKAAEVASRLVMRDKVDLMLYMHTPDTVNPVASMCERLKMPGLSLDAPLEPWLEGGPYKWTFHAFWSVEKDIVPVYMGMWDQIPTNKKVGILMANDPDGVSWSKVFKELGTKRGYTFVDLGRFPYFNNDFSTFINAWKQQKVEIIVGNTIPPDFITAWRQCHRLGFKPKATTVGKAILFPSAVGALGGDLALGLTSEVWWSPFHPFKSSLTGQSAKELCDLWEKENNKQWAQPLGYKLAGYDLAADALRRAGSLNKETLIKAIADTNLNTIVGPIHFNDQHYCRTPLVGGQWVKGKKYPWELNIVYNKEHPNIPLTGKLFSM